MKSSISLSDWSSAKIKDHDGEMATRSNSIASSAEEHSSAHFFDGGENEVGRDVWGLEPISLRSVEKDTSDPYRPDIEYVSTRSLCSIALSWSPVSSMSKLPRQAKSDCSLMTSCSLVMR